MKIYNKIYLNITVVFLVLLLGKSHLSGQQKTWTVGPFERPTDANPIITPDTNSIFWDPIHKQNVNWEAYATFNAAAVVKDNKIIVFYRAEGSFGTKKIGGQTSRLGWAESSDGFNFSRKKEPVFYPKHDDQLENEWPGGVEDPRIVETDDGKYVMTYTQWNREVPRLAVATSNDLINWEKHGPAFEKYKDGKYVNHETKSGAIVTERKGNHLIAKKINGKYWMYWGVPNIYLATSTDLVNWNPIEDDGDLEVILSPREGYYDSWLVEAGPPAIVTDDGILVIYNAGNNLETGDPNLGNKVYSGGQALYDKDDPEKLIDRTDQPFIKPEMEFEKKGQYSDGTTFLEGLVYFKNRWFIYYGTADSQVGVISWDPN